MPPLAWGQGPDMTAANGVIYGPYNYAGFAWTDEDGSLYFIEQAGFGNTQSFVRLDAPFTTYLQMWADPFSGFEQFAVSIVQRDHLIIAPESGSGAARYDKAQNDPGDGFNNGTTGPWEANDGSFFAPPGLPATWESILAGYNELNIKYCAATLDSDQRFYIIGRRSDGGDGTYNSPWDTVETAGNFSGYLDYDAAHWIRIADLPAISGDVNIEGHSACADRQDRVLVAGGLITAGPTDAFRRYDPGPAVGAGVVDIQRIRWTGDAPSGGDLYEVAVPRTYFKDGSFQDATAPVVTWNDNQATIQAAFDSYFGAGVVTIAGNGLDYTVTRILPGVQPRLTLAAGDLFTEPAGRVQFEHVQYGTGGPSVNTWTDLDALPVPLYRGVMISDGQSPEGIHYIGGHDGVNAVATHYRWREAGGWQQLNDLPDGLSTVTTTGTFADSRPGYLHNDQIVVFLYSLDGTQSAVCVFDLRNQRWGSPVYTAVDHQRGGFTVNDTAAWIFGGTNAGGTETEAVEHIALSRIPGGLHLGSLSWRSES